MNTRRGRARLDQRGRLVLPAALRRRLGLHPGDDLLVSEEADGGLRVEGRRAAATALIGLAAPVDHATVAELRAERLGVPAVTAERIWARLSLDVVVQLIRPARR